MHNLNVFPPLFFRQSLTAMRRMKFTFTLSHGVDTQSEKLLHISHTNPIQTAGSFLFVLVLFQAFLRTLSSLTKLPFAVPPSVQMRTFYFQRFSNAIFEGGLQPQFHRDMSSVSNSVREQCIFLETMVYLRIQKN